MSEKPLATTLVEKRLKKGTLEFILAKYVFSTVPIARNFDYAQTQRNVFRALHKGRLYI